MHNSKKAQISDTLSWIVATIIIVLILSIPILLINLGFLGGNDVVFYRMYDPIATNSISGYLSKNYETLFGKDLEDGELSLETKKSIDSFLATLARDKNEEWKLVVTVNNEEIYETKSPIMLKFAPDSKRAYNHFDFKEEYGVVHLEFWMISERGARDDIELK